MALLDAITSVADAVGNAVVSAAENLQRESGAIHSDSVADTKQGNSAVRETSTADNSTLSDKSVSDHSTGTVLPVDKAEVVVPKTPKTKAQVWTTTLPKNAPSRADSSVVQVEPVRAVPQRTHEATGTTDVARAREARTVVFFVPTDISRDKSRNSDIAQAAIAASRALGPQISVVVIEPSGQNSVKTSPAAPNIGSLTTVTVKNPQQMEGVLKLIANGEPLTSSDKALPVISTYAVINPSSQFGHDAIVEIGKADAINTQVKTTTLILEGDYKTIADIHGRTDVTGPLRQTEINAYTPTDARALLAADVIVGDAASRLGKQAAVRIEAGDIDPASTNLLRGLDTRNYGNASAIEAHIMKNVVTVPPISYSLAEKLRADIHTFTPEEARQLNPIGRVLVERAGLTRPLEDVVDHSAEIGARADEHGLDMSEFEAEFEGPEFGHEFTQTPIIDSGSGIGY